MISTGKADEVFVVRQIILQPFLIRFVDAIGVDSSG